MSYLISGGDYLKEKAPGFKLVGRANDLKRLTSVLMRSKAASVMLVGPGGVGSTALCMGLQAVKDDPDAPFDIVAKRLFWLDIDGLFSSGDNSHINSEFDKIVAILKRTPESILILEDTRDFIEAARNAGCSHFINSLNALVKNGQTQAILEVRDEDFEYVLKTHSDMKECYTMLDLAEPAGDDLMQIAFTSAAGLEAHHGISVDDAAVEAAVELTNKYRTRDMSLSRAQPERTSNLLDRALATYRLTAHSRHPEIAALLATKPSTDDEARSIEFKIAELDKEFEQTQEKLKRLFQNQRTGELSIIKLEEDLQAQLEKEKAARDKAREQAEESGDVEQRKISRFSRMSAVGGIESDAVVELRKQIKERQQLVAENREEFEALTKSINDMLHLTKEHVYSEFSRLSGIPANKLNEDEREKLKNLEPNINARLFGQESVVSKVSNAIKVARIGRRNGTRPQASFMFLGPSGVGKTELAKQVALNLLDDEKALTRFDMSEYMEKHAVAKLIGAPPGYEGYEAGGILTNAMRKNPVRIVLFDEIEKADLGVFDVLLQVLDDGRLTDSRGFTVDFSQSIVMLTTNLGTSFFLDDNLSEREQAEAAMELLDTKFRPEFLNRFAGRQNIICFNKLGIDSIVKIVRRELNSLDSAYSSEGIRTVMPEADLRAFCEAYYDPTTGARGLPGYIQAKIEPIIANTVIDNPDFSGELLVHFDSQSRDFKTELKRREAA